MRMKEGSTAVDHLNEFNTLINKILLVGFNVDGEEKVIISLCSLQDTWDYMVVTIIRNFEIS